jgi:hypothetical protein
MIFLGNVPPGPRRRNVFERLKLSASPLAREALRPITPYCAIDARFLRKPPDKRSAVQGREAEEDFPRDL